MSQPIFQYQSLASTPNTDIGAAPDPATFFCFFDQPRMRPHRTKQNFSWLCEPRAIFPPSIPDNPFAGPGKGLVPRDPEAEKRTRAGGQILAEVVNSLMRRGEIVMYGPKQWRLNASVAVEANRAPAVDDDADDGYMVGQIWVNSTSGDVYILVSSTPGAAVWRGPV